MSNRARNNAPDVALSRPNPQPPASGPRVAAASAPAARAPAVDAHAPATDARDPAETARAPFRVFSCLSGDENKTSRIFNIDANSSREGLPGLVWEIARKFNVSHLCVNEDEATLYLLPGRNILVEDVVVEDLDDLREGDYLMLKLPQVNLQQEQPQQQQPQPHNQAAPRGGMTSEDALEISDSDESTVAPARKPPATETKSAKKKAAAKTKSTKKKAATRKAPPARKPRMLSGLDSCLSAPNSTTARSRSSSRRPSTEAESPATVSVATRKSPRKKSPVPAKAPAETAKTARSKSPGPKTVKSTRPKAAKPLPPPVDETDRSESESDSDSIESECSFSPGTHCFVHEEDDGIDFPVCVLEPRDNQKLKPDERRIMWIQYPNSECVEVFPVSSLLKFTQERDSYWFNTVFPRLRGNAKRDDIAKSAKPKDEEIDEYVVGKQRYFYLLGGIEYPVFIRSFCPKKKGMCIIRFVNYSARSYEKTPIPLTDLLPATPEREERFAVLKSYREQVEDPRKRKPSTAGTTHKQPPSKKARTASTTTKTPTQKPTAKTTSQNRQSTHAQGKGWQAVSREDELYGPPTDIFDLPTSKEVCDMVHGTVQRQTQRNRLVYLAFCDEKPSEIAQKFHVPVEKILYDNDRKWKGMKKNSRLKRNTPIVLPLMWDGEDLFLRRLRKATAKGKQTSAVAAAKKAAKAAAQESKVPVPLSSMGDMVIEFESVAMDGSRQEEVQEEANGSPHGSSSRTETEIDSIPEHEDQQELFSMAYGRQEVWGSNGNSSYTEAEDERENLYHNESHNEQQLCPLDAGNQGNQQDEVQNEQPEYYGSSSCTEAQQPQEEDSIHDVEKHTEHEEQQELLSMDVGNQGNQQVEVQNAESHGSSSNTEAQQPQEESNIHGDQKDTLHEEQQELLSMDLGNQGHQEDEVQKEQPKSHGSSSYAEAQQPQVEDNIHDDEKNTEHENQQELLSMDVGNQGHQEDEVQNEQPESHGISSFNQSEEEADNVHNNVHTTEHEDQHESRSTGSSSSSDWVDPDHLLGDNDDDSFTFAGLPGALKSEVALLRHDDDDSCMSGQPDETIEANEASLHPAGIPQSFETDVDAGWEVVEQQQVVQQATGAGPKEQQGQSSEPLTERFEVGKEPGWEVLEQQSTQHPASDNSYDQQEHPPLPEYRNIAC